MSTVLSYNVTSLDNSLKRPQIEQYKEFNPQPHFYDIGRFERFLFLLPQWFLLQDG